MAMQVGMGLSRILLLIGAGYTGAIVLGNGWLSDILEDLQGLEKSPEESGADSDIGDALTLQVSDVQDKISNVGYELESLFGFIWVLKGKISSLEDKLNFTCAGITYLCEFVADKDKTMPDFLKDAPKPKYHYLGHKEEILAKSEQKQTSRITSISWTI